MLGFGKPLTYEEIVQRHRDLVAKKAAERASAPEAPPFVAELPTEPKVPKRRHRRQPAIEEIEAPKPRRITRLERQLAQKKGKHAHRERLSAEHDLKLDNAFNRMLVEAVKLTESKGSFSWEELCAACFKADPATFAMAGFPEWPDGSKVKVRLAHGKHLRNHRLVERAELGRYRATPEGASRAADLLTIQGSP